MNKKLDAIAALFAAITEKKPAPICFGPEEDHAAFLAANAPSEETLAAQRETELPCKPHFLIRLFPGGSAGDIARTEDSIKAQSYKEWSFLPEAPVDFDFILFLEAGDTLSPDALFRFAKACGASPEADAFYADEDVRLSDGSRGEACCKGVFSAVTVLSYDLLGRPTAVGKSLYAKAGGMQEAENMSIPAAEFDYGLRISRYAKKIVHLPYILCTRKKRPLPIPSQAGIRALETHMRKSGISGSASTGIYGGSFRIRPSLPEKEKTAIIIPNRDHADSLRRLLESIEEYEAFERYALFIADADSRDKRTLRYYDILEANKAAKIIRCKEKSFASLANMAAEKANSEALLFLDRSTQVLTPDWLRAMRELLQLPGVGAVGGKLIAPNRRIISAGAAAGLCGWTGTPYQNEPDDTAEARKNLFINSVRQTTLLSGACMMIKTEVFESIHGFDETFREAGADADLCLRLARKGLASVYTPFAALILHGSLPDIAAAGKDTRTRCYDTLRPILSVGDPFFSPNYSCDSFVPMLSPERKPPLSCRKYDVE
ncbi:MAG: glycosyltransferase [Clostridiales bacterium]|nr:glycosyltransferase [Clostridiales bacterium]